MFSKEFPISARLGGKQNKRICSSYVEILPGPHILDRYFTTKFLSRKLDYGPLS